MLPLIVLLLITLLIVIIGTANVVDSSGRGRLLFDSAVFFFGLLLLLYAIWLGQLSPDIAFVDSAIATPLYIGAFWIMAVALRPVRRLLGRVSRINPDAAVHTLALVATGLLVVNTAVTLSGGLDAFAENIVSAPISLVLGQNVIIIIAALLGVGLFIRRDWAAVVKRLGLTPLDGRQLRLAALWTVIFVIFQAVVGAFYAATNPSDADLLDTINTVLLAEIDTVGEWFLLALSSGVGEELLFRGALQPIFGLIPTTLLFTLPHVQYGITPITGVIFIFGLVLGLLRRRHGTTLVILIHTSYNFILGLIALAASLAVAS